MSSTLRSPDVQSWFDRNTLTDFTPDAGLIADLKREMGLTVSVCLPARDEAATVGGICSAIRSELVEAVELVDELVVVDSGSLDGSAELALAAGATVYTAGDLLPHLGSGPGKGEALWKSLSVLTGDVIVWLDSDISNFDPAFVTKLAAPLLLNEELVYTKGFYRRPVTEGGTAPSIGGRITELAVRPIFHLLYPQLTGFVQPLSGEYAGRRDALIQLPFFTGYAVEIGLLIDIVERFGLESIAQVDLGVRLHRPRDTLALGRAAHEIMHALFARLKASGRIRLEDLPAPGFVQFVHGPEGLEVAGSYPNTGQRPPMASVLDGGDNR